MELTKLNQAERTFILRKGAGQLNVGAFNINNSIQLENKHMFILDCIIENIS